MRWFAISCRRASDPNVVSGKGRADTHPLAPNDTKAGRAENRRIEVVAEQPTG
jgi:flagellar motor protein MotB